MMKRSAWLFFGAMVSLWTPEVRACSAGDVTVSFSPTSPNVPNWNPLPSGVQQVATISISVARTSSGGNIRSARLILRDSDTGTTLRFGSLGTFQGPIYTLDSTFPAGTALTTSNSIFFNTGNSTNPIVQSATLAVPANTAAADFTSGTYSQATTYFVQCYNSGNSPVGSGVTGTGPTLNVTVPNLLQTITAGPQTIDFGNFTTTTQNLVISLKSTGPIDAVVSTLNGNMLVLKTAQSPYPANSTISYNMTFDSQTVPSSGITLTNLHRAGVGGGSKALVLTLPGQPAGKLAGSYEDVITIVLSPGS
jgi:hypothetical protein